MRATEQNSRKGKPGRSEIAEAWRTAIGLQAADGLNASEFLWQVSKRSVNGEISVSEAREGAKCYHFESAANDAGDPEEMEADVVSANIAQILLEGDFELSTGWLLSLHRKMFDGVSESAGVLREQDLQIREWVLGGDSPVFTSVEAIQSSLEQLFDKERRFHYETETTDGIIKHLASLVSELWQICPFAVGNTRVAGVFSLLYLRFLGFEIESGVYAGYSWYFHNALVRANFRNLVKHIAPEPVYLERFFRNLLLGEQWDLRNRYVHVRPAAEWGAQPNRNASISTGQVSVKQDISKRQERGKKRTTKVEEGESPAGVEISTSPVSDTKEQSNTSEEGSSSQNQQISGPETPDRVISVENQAIIPFEVSETASSTVNFDTKPEENSVSGEVDPVENPNILFLAVVIGDRFLSVKEIMEGLGLKGRDNFLKLYLSPAVCAGLVRLLYPMSPRHPRQRYMLTAKGLAFLNSLGPEMTARVQQHLASQRQ